MDTRFGFRVRARNDTMAGCSSAACSLPRRRCIDRCDLRPASTALERGNAQRTRSLTRALQLQPHHPTSPLTTLSASTTGRTLGASACAICNGDCPRSPNRLLRVLPLSQLNAPTTTATPLCCRHFRSLEQAKKSFPNTCVARGVRTLYTDCCASRQRLCPACSPRNAHQRP